MKAIWKGNISIGLINIPVKLYSATEEHPIKFRELHQKCGTPLEHKRWCPKCNVEVPWEEVEKGFEISEGVYVPITQDELKQIKLKGIKEIELLGFVDPKEVPEIYYDKHYYLGPQEGQDKAFLLFKKTLEDTGLNALGRIVIRSNERLVLIQSYKNVLLLNTLFYAYEIRDPSEIVVNSVELKENELNLAKELFVSMRTKFDISKYHDRFLDALKELINAKLKGEELKVEERKTEEEKSLEEALKEMIRRVKKKHEDN